ncbi:MAG: Smr/MutS family protein [Bacteroidota bacterium]
MFKLGEKITFLHDSGFGIVTEIISPTQVKVRDDFGFEQVFYTKDLVKIHGSMEGDYTPVPKEEEQHKIRSNYSIQKDRSSAGAKDYWELDLHIESLTEDHRSLSNFEIMKIQMGEFKRFLSKARANGIQKLVVIHGVGEGVLKNEIRNYLAQQEFLEFYDASYLEYGKGATEIRLYIQR